MTSFLKPFLHIKWGQCSFFSCVTVWHLTPLSVFSRAWQQASVFVLSTERSTSLAPQFDTTLTNTLQHAQDMQTSSTTWCFSSSRKRCCFIWTSAQSIVRGRLSFYFFWFSQVIPVVDTDPADKSLYQHASHECTTGTKINANYNESIWNGRHQ